MTKPVPGAVRGRPPRSMNKVRVDPDDSDIPQTIYCYWIGGPPYLTDDPHPVAPDALTPLFIPLTSFNLKLLRTNYTPPTKRTKAESIIRLVHNNPGLTLSKLAAVSNGISPIALYAHLNRLIINTEVSKKYNEDGDRIYFTPHDLPPEPKYSWTVSQDPIIFAGHHEKLYALSPLLHKFDWAVKRRAIDRVNIDWPVESVTDDLILDYLLNHPWSTLSSLVNLYRRTSGVDWATHELTYVTDNMKRRLYYLKRRGLLIECDGLYNLVGE